MYILKKKNIYIYIYINYKYIKRERRKERIHAQEFLPQMTFQFFHVLSLTFLFLPASFVGNPGWYYALRLQRGGSLWETIFLHAINNTLAVLFDSALVDDRASLLLGVAATIGEL